MKIANKYLIVSTNLCYYITSHPSEKSASLFFHKNFKYVEGYVLDFRQLVNFLKSKSKYVFVKR